MGATTPIVDIPTDLKIYRLVDPADDSEVTVVGQSTREERDAEGRKHALDLNLFEAKRPRTESSELQVGVARARSMCAEAVEAKTRTLLKDDFEAFVGDKIDAATLESRKAAARLEAEKGHPRLAKLNAAYDAYTSAVATRVAAEDVEDGAEAAVRAAVNELLPVGGSSGGAGPSGVVKSERRAL